MIKSVSHEAVPTMQGGWQNGLGIDGQGVRGVEVGEGVRFYVAGARTVGGSEVEVVEE